MTKQPNIAARRFIKFSLLAFGLQLFFLFGGYVLFFGPSGEREFRNSLVLNFYDPFIRFVIAMSQTSGEASMIWPPLFGVLLGTITYSILFGLAVAILTYLRR